MLQRKRICDTLLRNRAGWGVPHIWQLAKPAAVQGDLIFDELTKLTWPKDANLAGFPLTWNESLAYIDNINQQKFFGYSDWKLPTKKQLFSLVSHRQVNPALTKDHPFMNVFNGYYWTSTEVARYPLQAWYVHFGGGRVFKGMKHGS